MCVKFKLPLGLSMDSVFIFLVYFFSFLDVIKYQLFILLVYLSEILNTALTNKNGDIISRVLIEPRYPFLWCVK